MNIINKVLIICCLALVSCSNNRKLPIEQEIQGIWFNGYSSLYFNENDCLIRKSKIQKIKFNSNDSFTIIDNDSLKKQEIYIPKIINDTLWLNKNDTRLQAYTKCNPRHSEEIKQLQYSQLTDYNKYNLEINENLEFKLELHIYVSSKIKDGKYKGRISPKLYTYINQHFQLMELDQSNKLKNGIVSDIQEWAAIIQTQKGEEHTFYYNYENNGRGHKIFEFAMNTLPFLLELNETTLEINLDKIENFRTSEFERNIQETNSKLKD